MITLDSPERELAAVGACIYCETVPEDVRQLTEEHIIPDGIGGDLTLPHASCSICQDKINKWEQVVQKRNLGVTRDASGIKSRKRRRRSQRPTGQYYAVADCPDDSPRAGKLRGTQIMDITKLPRMIAVETTMGPPELLGGSIPGNGLCIESVWDLSYGPENCDIEIRPRTGDFMRLLAKIAHGFAVASIGLDGFSPFLNDIIRMHDHDFGDFWKYIGRGPDVQPTQDLHRVRLKRDVAWIRAPGGLASIPLGVVVADIQLFANFSPPCHSVVVGLIKPNFVQPAA